MTRRERKILMERWRGFTRALSDPAVELTPEEFAPIASTFDALRTAGRKFDPTLVAVMAQLERQLLRGETDADLEDDDPTSDKWTDDDPDTDVSIDTSWNTGERDWQKSGVMIRIKPDGEREQSGPPGAAPAA